MSAIDRPCALDRPEACPLCCRAALGTGLVRLGPVCPGCAWSDRPVVSALFVMSDGPYTGLRGVDWWDASRDARLYDGPFPVICHSPCERWGRYWHGGPSARVRRVKGDDGGCFAAALQAVRRFGGVLEHPSSEWERSGMRRVKDRVPMDECKRRALEYLREWRERIRYIKASSVAGAIWPGVEFKPQGAGAAASRILRVLQKDGLVVWSASNEGDDWGWRIRNGR